MEGSPRGYNSYLVRGPKKKESRDNAGKGMEEKH